MFQFATILKIWTIDLMQFPSDWCIFHGSWLPASQLIKQSLNSLLKILKINSFGQRCFSLYIVLLCYTSCPTGHKTKFVKFLLVRSSISVLVFFLPRCSIFSVTLLHYSINRGELQAFSFIYLLLRNLTLKLSDFSHFFIFRAIYFN